MVTHVGVNGVHCLTVYFDDPIRETARDTIRGLKALGVQVRGGTLDQAYSVQWNNDNDRGWGCDSGARTVGGVVSP
jgi:hypothetical protein